MTIENIKKVLGLRTVNASRQAYDNFQWPELGLVEAPDWDPKAECGNGLHALVKGEGNHELLSDNPTAIWQVVEIVESEIVDLDGKAKFPRCNVIYSGSKDIAIGMVKEAHPEAAVAFANVSVGDGKVSVVGGGGFATAGNCGTATAGNDGTATAGKCGTATTGHEGTATAGNDGTATAGKCGTATTGWQGTATAGDYGRATVDNSGTATAGERGTATAGHYGTATAGNYGTATAGWQGTATAGQNGIISIKHWDGKRYRFVTGYIGEDGLLPNVAYKLDNGKFVKE